MKTMRLLLALLMLSLSGCISHFPDAEQQPGNKEWAPPEVDYSLPEAKDGSLYRPGFMLTLFKDKRAFREETYSQSPWMRKPTPARRPIPRPISLRI
ncbi:hypothetical protein ACWAU3_23280 [Shewanella sp. JL219SE-S6]